MIFGLLISALGLTRVSFVTTYIGFLVFFIIFEIGTAMFSSASLSFLSEKTLPQQQGAVMGFYGAMGENMGIIAGTVLGGSLGLHRVGCFLDWSISGIIWCGSMPHCYKKQGLF